MKHNNDEVKGLKGKIKNKENGKKRVVVNFSLNNKLGYDGCGAHTHQ